MQTEFEKLKDRDLPEEIKQKFYNRQLSFEEYLEYEDKFEGIMVGIGIDDKTGIAEEMGDEVFTQLIHYDKYAIEYLQNIECDMLVGELGYQKGESFEKIKEVFSMWMKGIVNLVEEDIFTDDRGLNTIKNSKFFRERLAELFISDDAPEELKDLYYSAKLNLNALYHHPEWLPWIEGKDEYMKSCCIEYREYSDWRFSDFYNEPEELNNYLLRIYEEEIREDIIDKGHRKYLRNTSIDYFKSRNPDLFFDDLPEHLQRMIEYEELTFEKIFILSEEEKSLLKGKKLRLGFNNKYKGFFEIFGDDIEDFELYQQYEGIIDTIGDYLKNNILPRKEIIDDKKAMMEKVSLMAIDDYRKYGEKMPDEFKDRYPQFFLDEDAPEELKKVFYHEERGVNFVFLKKNPEFVAFLKDKNSRQLFGRRVDAFYEFCGSDELAIELGIKYADVVHALSKDYFDFANPNIEQEKALRELIDTIINGTRLQYSDALPEDFKEQYPDLFLSEEELKRIKSEEEKGEELLVGEYLKSRFYQRNVHFSDFQESSVIKEILRNKNLKVVMNIDYQYLMDFCNNDIDRFIEIGCEYGDILKEGYFLKHRFPPNTNFSKLSMKKVIEIMDEAIYDGLRGADFYEYDDSISMRFQRKNPELFLLPEELKQLEEAYPKNYDELKDDFYNRYIHFRTLKEYPVLKEILKNKDYSCYMRSEGAEEFLDGFIKLVGDKDKAFNLACGKLAEKLDDLLNYDDDSESDNARKLLEYYEKAGFIPKPSIVRKLPQEYIKGFALNKNLWAKLMQIEEYSNSNDYTLSLLEAAVVMGVFETKEFIRDGQTRLQGAGEKGYEKLKKMLRFYPDYIDEYDDSKRNDLVKNKGYEDLGQGYIKREPDYQDELKYGIIEKAAKRNEMDLNQGMISYLDIHHLREDTDMNLTEILGYFRERFFDSTGREYYKITLDRKSNDKVKMLLKTLGIKEDKILSTKEWTEIKRSNRKYIEKAFVETEDGYKFNVFIVDGKCIIGENLDIGEKESKSNKKLFNYVRFLMMEYGLNAEGLRLAANHDRSNIDLVLDDNKMERLLKAADTISAKTTGKYIYSPHILKSTIDNDKYISGGMLHSIFDGMKLEYNKEFSDIMFENMENIMNDDDLVSIINPIQTRVIDMSSDPDYAEKKITLELALRAILENNYIGKKTGFEKGIELAQKFAFDQEYFEEAQRIWELGRKREASSIPRIEGKEDEYSYEVLRLDDAAGIFIGNITDCCQKVGGAGESSMLHSMTEKNGRVFVVRDADKKIISQSWLWRNGDVVCFDNVEIPYSGDNEKNQNAIYEIMKRASKELCEKDKEVIEELVAEGKITKEVAEQIQLKKVTVGTSNNDLDRLYESETDKQLKYPVELGQYYRGIGGNKDKLYIDSSNQVVLYEADGYEFKDDIPTLAIHHDSNIEKSCRELTDAEFKRIVLIEKEVEGYTDIESIDDLVSECEVEELNVVLGTDWYMLYSEKDEEITVHKMLKSPSSGIMKKSIREQREAVKMLMDKGKNISMEFENDRVHKAAKSMVRHMQKRYTMKVADERDRISVSEIEIR